MNEQKITWGAKEIKLLQKAYKKAIKEKQSSFELSVDGTFPPLEYNTQYAGYLLEFLERHLAGV